MSVLAVASISLVSCGDDDPEPTPTSSSTSSSSSTASLVGTWKYTYSSGYVLLTFTQDGRGIYTEYKAGWEVDDDSFTYTYANNTITMIIFEGEDYDVETCKVLSLTSSTLVLQDFPDPGKKCTFYKQ